MKSLRCWNIALMGDPGAAVNPLAVDCLRARKSEHFTTSATERDACVSAGWTYEGVGWKSGGAVPVYREYNPCAAAFSHNYTASREEHDLLVSIGWRDEGVGWYGTE